MKWVGIDMGKI